MGRRPEDDDDGDEEAPVIDTRLHEAVMLGAPCDGGELVLVTTDWVGQPVTVCTAGPIRRTRTGKQPALPATADTDTARLQRQAREEGIAATLTPADGPLRWGPGTVDSGPNGRAGPDRRRDRQHLLCHALFRDERLRLGPHPPARTVDLAQPRSRPPQLARHREP